MKRTTLSRQAASRPAIAAAALAPTGRLPYAVQAVEPHPHFAALDEGAREHDATADAPGKDPRLGQADTEITAAIERVIRLRIERRRLADKLNPTVDGVPLDAKESYRQQYASAAFSLAWDAMTAALEASADPASTHRTLRWVLDDLAEDLAE